jgi:hypothetical protein
MLSGALACIVDDPALGTGVSRECLERLVTRLLLALSLVKFMEFFKFNADNPAEQIRLLTVLQSRTNDSLTEATFSTHPIPASNASSLSRFRAHARLPSHYAVSYVWGPEAYQVESRKILVEGEEFPVTDIHAALKEFRPSNIVSLRLWIDSICINQKDNVVKSGQIRIMREVFIDSCGFAN